MMVPPHTEQNLCKSGYLKKIYPLYSEWPGNSPDPNPIENAWNVMKKKVQEAQPVNISELTHALKTLWVTMETDYFEKLVNLMPRRLQDVIQAKGFMTKY